MESVSYPTRRCQRGGSYDDGNRVHCVAWAPTLYPRDERVEGSRKRRGRGLSQRSGGPVCGELLILGKSVIRHTHDSRAALVALAEDFEQQLGAGRRQRNVA